MTNKKKSDLTKKEKAWILYDVGNSAYTMLACSLIPIWFKNLAIGNAAGQLSSDAATGMWSLATAIVTVVVALIGPALGAVADRKGFKKPVFMTALAIGIGCCVLNGFANNWVVFIVLYVATKIAYSSCNTFYDSMLNDVTTEERMDEVSSYGYAWGYIGSCAPFLVALIFYVLDYMAHKIDPTVARIIGFLVTAAWWALVTVPLLKNYEQINYVDKEHGSVSAVFKQIFGTLKKIFVHDKKVLLFLLAFFLYIDGVGTIIDNCINIGTDLGLDTVGQVVFLLATQVVAWLFSLLFAKLSKKYDTVNLISICILGYFCVCVYALTLKELWQFGIMAFGVGMFQGSIQSLSRSYYSKIIPAENSGEYFGIYDIFSKGASFLGSAVIAAVKFAGGTINIAVGSLTVFFLLGFIFLRMADKTKARTDVI